MEIDGMCFVRYEENERRAPRVSKARLIHEFLRENGTGVLFQGDSRGAQGQGNQAADVMTSVRRLEKKGLVCVRGYKSGSREIPFKEGFLITG